MRVFKNKWFVRFARKEHIGDDALTDAVNRIVRGDVDADLGGGVIKQRIARAGQGRSGGLRVILLFRRDDRVFFVYGFAKSRRDNIDERELNAFREAAKDLLSLDKEALAKLLRDGAITEMDFDA